MSVRPAHVDTTPDRTDEGNGLEHEFGRLDTGGAKRHELLRAAFWKTEAWPTGPGQLVGLGRMHEDFAVRKFRMGADVIDMRVRRKDSLVREDRRARIGRSAATPIPLSTKISRSVPRIRKQFARTHLWQPGSVIRKRPGEGCVASNQGF